jgi:CTP:molybdopterin cytidylyltransferase MocA
MSAGPAAAPVVTVVLAAGKGERLGGPKALLAWPTPAGERPLSIAHAAARLAAESARVLVVTRQALLRPLFAHVLPGIDLLASTAPDRLGPAGSLGFARASLADAAAVVVTPVDTPPARAETVAALLAHLDAHPGLLAVRPRHDRRGGHPVVLRQAALDAYALPEPPPLREHLRALGKACADVDVDDAAVLVDLDTPAQAMSWLRAPPRFLT